MAGALAAPAFGRMCLTAGCEGIPISLFHRIFQNRSEVQPLSSSASLQENMNFSLKTITVLRNAVALFLAFSLGLGHFSSCAYRTSSSLCMSHCFVLNLPGSLNAPVCSTYPCHNIILLYKFIFRYNFYDKHSLPECKFRMQPLCSD